MTAQLLVVVDTEEEFDWTRPFSRSATSTRSIPAQALAHEIFDPLGVVPTYVVDYPVATDPAAVSFLRELLDSGRADIGTHLHPWVTPPHEEAVSTRNSYHCNLPAALERAKIETMTNVISGSFGKRPTIFKAGRHGFGAETARILADLGYRVDCSQLPHTDLGADGGPDFRGIPDRPYWLDEARGLLEVPLSVGFHGLAPAIGPRIAGLFDSPVAIRAHLPGLLARGGVVARARITPEGVSAAEQIRLIRAMHRRGHRLFSLVYHSPSLVPGNTPYVRSEEELHAFLAAIAEVLRFFRDELGGTFTTLGRVHERMSSGLRLAA